MTHQSSIAPLCSLCVALLVAACGGEFIDPGDPAEDSLASALSLTDPISTTPTLKVPYAQPSIRGSVAAGLDHTCAITSHGAVKCWGRNTYGQLGDGTNTDRDTPVQVKGLTADAEAIVAGDHHTCAIIKSGVKCWGRNNQGQLGNDGYLSRNTPVDASSKYSPINHGIVAITAGAQHTCALTSDGTVKCWGYNNHYQTGNQEYSNLCVPHVVYAVSNIVAIAAGRYHTCALTGAGAVKCWGYNENGQLGISLIYDRWSPADVTGLGSGVTAITASRHHTCALMSDGTARCWGENFAGQLGNGNTTEQRTPVAVSGLGGVVSISTGLGHTCAVTSTGAARCWGSNYHGQLGSGGTASSTTPVAVLGAGKVAAITAGGLHTCALTTTDIASVRCWGRNAFGQLGDGTSTSRSTPVTVAVGNGFTALAAGGEHTCALSDAGGVTCWGSNSSSQLGMGQGSYYGPSVADRVAVHGLDSGVVAISAGYRHTCALTSAGAVKCWGDNSHGQLGTGTYGSDACRPGDVSGLGSGVVAIAAGGSHSCALTGAGAVKCWGNNSHGQLGNGNTTEQRTPVAVSGLGSGVVAIAAGSGHTCAVKSNGAALCWGYNYHGQLGLGGSTDRNTPVAVSLGSKAVDIVAGWHHTCAVTSSGVKCWGYNNHGQLGIGSTTLRRTPVAVYGLGSGVAAITAGHSHTCALMTTGAARCWGYNGAGQLGDGTSTDRLTAVGVYGLGSGVPTIAGGWYHTCATTSTGGARCWGKNSKRQLGDESAVDRSRPVHVR